MPDSLKDHYYGLVNGYLNDAGKIQNAGRVRYIFADASGDKPCMHSAYARTAQQYKLFSFKG